MVSSSSQGLRELLAKWRAGDESAQERLLSLVYEELRRIAHHYLRKERPGHTLQTTALVHEAYLRMTKEEPRHFENRAHFLAISAHLMRQILVEYARSRGTAKRDGGRRITLEDAVSLGKNRGVDLAALDDALNGLARVDARQSQIVELRFFGGLSIEETAEVLDMSPSTVKRQWERTRLWLHHEMSRNAHT